MNKLYTFFSYNFIKIIKNNIKNNEKKTLKKQEKTKLFNLILKKEICALIFVLINFLITLTSSITIYRANFKNHIFIHIVKDNILTSVIWFIILTVLPIITGMMITKKLKSKHYLILLILYILSNIFNILMLVYFITAFINNVILGILGIINIIVTLIININIIIKIKENYLK